MSAGGRPNRLDRLPAEAGVVLRRLQLLPTRFILAVHVATQTLRLWKRGRVGGALPEWRLQQRYLISTAALGVGQTMHSHRTPLGLHRVARKIGRGEPIGTVFQARRAVGLTWQALPQATIVHRILWLEGLEPGWNQGGQVDSFNRFIYIHGFGDETTLGQPRSKGCIHMAARDLLPLFDLLPVGSLVWIAER